MATGLRDDQQPSLRHPEHAADLAWYARRRGALVQAVLITAVLLLVAMVAVPPFLTGALLDDPLFRIGAVGVPAYAVLAFWARRGPYATAAHLYVAMTFALLVAYSWLIQGSGHLVGNFAYLSYAIILSAFFLKLRYTLVYALLGVGVVVVLDQVYGVSAIDLALSVLYLATFSALLILMAWTRDRDQAALEETAHELAIANSDHETVLEHTPDAILSLDRDWRLMAFNGTAALIARHTFGLEPHRGLRIPDHVPDADWKAVEPMLDAAASGRPTVFDFDVELDDGKRCYQASLHPILESDEPAGVNLICRDVTEAKGLDEERETALEGLRKEILSVAAHELNTPLTPMRFAISHLKRTVHEADAQRAIALLERNVTRFQDSVQDILDVASIEDARPASTFVPLEPVQVVQEAIDALGPTLKKSDIECDLLVRSPRRAMGEPALLRKALIQVLDAACASVGAEGRLQVMVHRQEDDVVIDVQDGRHAMQTMSLGTAATRHLVGRRGVAGLGLYLSASIIEAHGGRIEAAFGPDERGCRFLITLPSVPRDAAQHDEPEATSDPVVFFDLRR